MMLRKVGKVILIVLLVLAVAAVLLCLTHLSATKIVWQNLTSPHAGDGYVGLDGRHLL